VPPPGPPILSIDALRPAGGPEVPKPTDGVCVELGRDPEQTITVVMFDKNKGQIPLLTPATAAQQSFTLLPPFACVGTPGCGYLLLTVDPAGPRPLVVASASISIDVPMARLRRPLDDHEFVVELRNSDGTSVKDDKGKPFVVTRNVRVAKTCGQDAGADGSAPVADSGANEGGADASSLDAARRDAAPRDGASPDGPNPGDASALDSGRISDSALPPTGG
jgi:hypothetical protein